MFVGFSIGLAGAQEDSVGYSSSATADPSPDAQLPAPASIIDEFTATFDDFPLGTIITTQYQDLGLDFSQFPVFLSPDRAQPTTPVLSGTPRFMGPVGFRVVDPTTGAPTRTNRIQADVGYIDNRDSVEVRVYGTSGLLLSTVRTNSFGINEIAVSIQGIARVEISATREEPAGFSVDNVRIDEIVPIRRPIERMIMFGDSYSSGEGLLPENGLRYDCGTDTHGGLYWNNTNLPNFDRVWNTDENCDHITGSTQRPDDLFQREWVRSENQCHRHGDAYPNLIREALGVTPTNAIFLACSGATTLNVGIAPNPSNEPQWPTSPRNVAGGNLQIDDARNFDDRGEPDLVTIGIGGNDANFRAIVETCVRKDCLRLPGFVTDTLVTVDTTMYDRLVDTFTLLRAEYQTATIAAFGYPSIVDPDLEACGGYRRFAGFLDLGEEERQWAVDVLLPAINTAISDASRQAGISYIDITAATVGHEICAEDEWVNGIRFRGGAFHPNQEAHRAIAGFFVEHYTDGNAQLTFENQPPVDVIRPPAGIVATFEAGDVDVELQDACGRACLAPDTCDGWCVVRGTLHGFTPQTQLEVRLIRVGSLARGAAEGLSDAASDPVVLGTVDIDASGQWTGALNVPRSVPSGQYLVEATGTIVGGQGLQIGNDFLVIDRNFDPTDATAVPTCKGERATITGSGRIRGTARADVIVGSPQADIILGRSGADKLCGRGGADTLRGGSGRDTINGGLGADRISGNHGPDSLVGGRGRDIASGGAGNDTIRGNAGWDRLAGGPGNDTLRGGAGRDTLSGGSGSDFCNGGKSVDILRASCERRIQ